MIARPASLLLSLLLTRGLPSVAPYHAHDSLRSPTVSPDSTLGAFIQLGEHFGTSEHEIRQRLGEPDSINVLPFQNLHDSTQTDSILRLYYADLTLRLYRVVRESVDLLIHVTLAGTGHPLPSVIGVGAAREQLVTLFGPPGAVFLDDAGVETLEYMAPEGMSYVRFALRDGRVERIEWSYFVD